MGYATGLTFLGTVRLRGFWGLAQVLNNVSTIKINARRSKRVRRNQLVITTDKINRFYMQYKISWLQHGK